MSKKNDATAEPGAENLIILADDSGETSVATGMPGNAPEAPKQLSSVHDGSWYGSRVNESHERFLESNASELAAFEAAERETRSCRNQFRWFGNQILESQQRIETIRAEIDSYKGVDVAQSLFQNIGTSGKSVFQIVVDLQSNASFLTVVLLKEYGANLMELFQMEHQALGQKFAAFKREKRTKLQELGLI